MKIATKEYWGFIDNNVLVFKTENEESIYLNFISAVFHFERWGYKKEENRVLNANFL